MKIRAKLKDIVIVPESDFEHHEVLKMMGALKDPNDPENKFSMDLYYRYSGSAEVMRMNIIGPAKPELVEDFGS